jgi:predicted DNA-binding transcriptional regulator YafY
MQDAPTPAEITRILHEWQAGSREALDRLMPIVYDELRVLASRQLAREWRLDRMQTTAVVSEAYVKLFGQREVDWQNRGHFFAIAAQMMRRIFGGLTVEETAAALGISARTVKRDWALAKGWLYRELTGGVSGPEGL